MNIMENSVNKYEEYKNMYNGLIRVTDDNDTGVLLVDLRAFFPSKEKKRYNKLTEYVLHLTAKAVSISQSHGKETILVYVNLKGSTIRNMSVKYFRYINELLAKALPNRLERCYLCSNSRLVKIFMGMIWEYVDKDTREKFTLCKNSEKFEM